MNKDKEKTIGYYKYFYELKDKTAKIGWRWVQCDYKTYKEHKEKYGKFSVCKSRN